MSKDGYTEFEFACNVCNRHITIQVTELMESAKQGREAIRLARLKDWYIDHRYVYCPVHAPLPA